MQQLQDAVIQAERSMDLLALVKDKPFLIDVIWEDTLDDTMNTARKIAEGVREKVARMNLGDLVMVNQRNTRVVLCKGES